MIENTVYGISYNDILKIKILMDEWAFREHEFNEFLTCFSEEKARELNLEKMKKQRDNLNEMIAKEELNANHN